MITVLLNAGYGNPNTTNAGYVGIGEGLSYYADKVLSNYCWLNYYNRPLDYTNAILQSNEWFRPDLLDTIARKSNGTWQLENYYNILSPDITTMCDFKKAIVYDITSQFAGMADTALAPVCHNMYTLDK